MARWEQVDMLKLSFSASHREGASLLLTGIRRQSLPRENGWAKWRKRSVTIGKITEIYDPSLMLRG